MEAHGCVLEGDSATVVGWGLGKGGGSWKLAHVMYEILDLSDLLGVSYVHVLRDQNCLVDKLANLGVGLSSIYIGSELLNMGM